ncbi:MAG TPA: FtsX-like permease family protein [Treponemataceae bacterium]|nr:FtsX-like permease family protein [Treponemataceae bacterium]
MNALGMAMRNVFRYRRRSLITAAAIGFGVMFTIAIDGMLAGTERESARNIRDYETGDIKVYPPEYFDDRAVSQFTSFIERDDRKRLEAILGDRRWTPRVNAQAELDFGEEWFAVPGSVQATLTAVDPVRDGDTLAVARMVDSGRWLRKGDTGIVIGSWLADDIGAKPGYWLTVECKGRGGFYQTFDAEILGTVTTENPVVNRNGAFIALDAADELLALEGGVTEYVIRSRKGDGASAEAKELSLAAGGLPVDVRTWEEIAHDEILLTKAKSSGSKLYLFFMFIIAAVGISNTMLMAVMERRHEIGMLRSLGYPTIRIRGMFVVEGFCIGLLGAAMGLVGGIALDVFMIVKGIDFSFMLREMDVGYRITGVMRSAWNLPGIVSAVVGSLVISTFVAWFPSGKMLRKEVAEILRS